LNKCTITRSAQPNVGVRLSRSPQDEKLVGAIFNSTKPNAVTVRSTPATPRNDGSSSDLTKVEEVTSDIDSLNVTSQPVEDSTENVSSTQSSMDVADVVNGKIYGAQQTNMIIDARPSVNAMANHAKGYGSERMDGYKGAQKQFLGIDNIHVMRNSLEQVIDALKDSDLTTFPPNRMILEKSKWRKHIDLLLQGTRLIAHTIAIQHSHVLIHCSDGWDRTSQLSSLAQMCLDPFYRTMEGFITLIEKDWLSFGYMFRLRSGPLSHEKWFEIENDRIAGFRNGEDGVAESELTGNAFESAISKAQLFFRRRNELGDEDSDAEPLHVESSSASHLTKLSDVSPVFHQFLDATYQLLRQNPTRFEFNERFLRRLLYHLYSCQYGTFLYNCEKERVDSKASERTKSVWSYFLSRRSQFINKNYDAEIDEMVKEKASLLEVNPQDVRWWHELFGRTELEMNGPAAPPPPTLDNVVEGTQSASESISSSMEQAGDGALFGTVSNVNYMSGVSNPSSSSNTGTPTKTTTSTVSNMNLRFARMEENPKKPLEAKGETLTNTESTISRTEAPMTPERDPRWMSGLLGKTKTDPLDVEMQ
jgi:myotubularin-related protein 6/7/8